MLQAGPPAFVAFNFLIQSEKEKFRNLLGVISTPTWLFPRRDGFSFIPFFPCVLNRLWSKLSKLKLLCCKVIISIKYYKSQVRLACWVGTFLSFMITHYYPNSFTQSASNSSLHSGRHNTTTTTTDWPVTNYLGVLSSVYRDRDCRYVMDST